MTIRTRKIILWLVVLLAAAVLLFFWIKSIPQRLESFRGQDFTKKLNFPKLEILNIESVQETSTTTQ